MMKTRRKLSLTVWVCRELFHWPMEWLCCCQTWLSSWECEAVESPRRQQTPAHTHVTINHNSDSFTTHDARQMCPNDWHGGHSFGGK